MGRKLNKVQTSLPREDWCTPPDILDGVRFVLEGQIGLDPCWNKHALTDPVVKFDLTQGQDAFQRKWPTGSRFANPPYSRDANPAWAQLLHRDFYWEKEDQMILIPESCGQVWWEPNFDSTAIAFLGRVQFLGAPHVSPFNLCMVLRTLSEVTLDRFRRTYKTTVLGRYGELDAGERHFRQGVDETTRAIGRNGL